MITLCEQVHDFTDKKSISFAESTLTSKTVYLKCITIDCYMDTYHQIITHIHAWQYTTQMWQLPGMKCVCVSNSVYKYSFLLQIHTQSLISVLKSTAGSIPDDTYKALLLSVGAMNLDTWAPPTVAISMKAESTPEGLPPQYFLDGSGHNWYRCVLDWLWCFQSLLNQKLLLDLVSPYHCTDISLSAIY